MKTKTLSLIFAWLFISAGAPGTGVIRASELRVPAFTAYVDPDPEGLEISESEGVTGWNDPSKKVSWFGQINNPGKLGCALALRLPPGEESKLRLTVAGKAIDFSVRGGGTKGTVVPVGSFDVSSPGYQHFTLESLNPTGRPAGHVEALVLSGPAARNAQFNLQERRNAASVHLAYALMPRTNIEAFYCEVTALTDPIWTFYMACGWHRGYFGMQVNSAQERRIIFSVWDSGNEAVDRSKVQTDNRVTLIAKGQGVFSGDFGNEETGGHSHLVYPWKTGMRHRFIVTAKPTDATHTIYSGYYFLPDQQRWMLISSWKAPGDGGYLHGLHSFSENFGGANGHLQRKALYGNQWIRSSGGDWFELTSATFSHDQTGRTNRLDRFMGVESDQFFLSHGGFFPGCTKFGEKFTRPAVGKSPTDLVLPE